jgi:predicted RNA binding protein YcfA (HicA-like mRNA interferase family)
VIRRLEREDWTLVRTRGSHLQFKHPAKQGKVTVPEHPNDQLADATWQSFQRQVGW